MQHYSAYYEAKVFNTLMNCTGTIPVETAQIIAVSDSDAKWLAFWLDEENEDVAKHQYPAMPVRLDFADNEDAKAVEWQMSN